MCWFQTVISVTILSRRLFNNLTYRVLLFTFQIARPLTGDTGRYDESKYPPGGGEPQVGDGMVACVSAFTTVYSSTTVSSLAVIALVRILLYG